MSTYELKDSYPQGIYDQYHDIMLKARNFGWAYDRIALCINSTYGENFTAVSIRSFCERAFRLKSDLPCYNPDDNTKWSNVGLQLLEVKS